MTTKKALSAQDDNEDAAPIMDGNAGDGQDGEKKRKTRTFMDPNEIWRLYNDSVEINGMSLSMLVRSKQNDRQGGVSETTSTWWMKKAMRMYCRRASISFMGIKRINIVADASRHSTFECLVSVFYTQQIPQIIEICQARRDPLQFGSGKTARRRQPHTDVCL